MWGILVCMWAVLHIWFDRINKSVKTQTWISWWLEDWNIDTWIHVWFGFASRNKSTFGEMLQIKRFCMRWKCTIRKVKHASPNPLVQKLKHQLNLYGIFVSECINQYGELNKTRQYEKNRTMLICVPNNVETQKPNLQCVNLWYFKNNSITTKDKNNLSKVPL